MTIAFLRKDLADDEQIPPVISERGLEFWKDVDWNNATFNVVELKEGNDEFNLWLFSEPTGSFFASSIDFEFEG